MSNLPLVSICIPSYNSEKWIDETIQSSLNQTWQNKEIIIVDDGSTDNTWNIVENYANKYPTIIKVFRQENKGACAARNLAFEMSSGEYIQWLDSDDILASDKIEIQMTYALKTNDPFKLYFGPYGIFYKKVRKAEFIPDCLWQDLQPLDWMVNYLSKSLMLSNASWLMHKRIIIKSGLWNTKLFKNQDGEFAFRLVANSNGVIFTPQAKMYYRKGIRNSISSNFSEKSINSVYESLIMCISILFNYKRNEITEKAAISAIMSFLNKYHYYKANSVEEALLFINTLGINNFKLKRSKLFQITEILTNAGVALKIKDLWSRVKLKLKSFV